MSTLQHINSTLDHFWPEYSRRFPAFDKPEIVPAETLRGMAPVYMRRLIDQDPSSFYLFVHADPMRGDASRERMVEFVDDFFYEKLRMPSSYDVAAGVGGDLPRDQAVDKEVMPARDDSEYQRYFDEQMAAAEAQRAEQERQKRIERLGFDPDDGNTIDVGDYSPAPSSRSVGQAGTSAVGMPKRIWYCVDFHCPSGGMLGYSGGRGGRLNGRRRSGGYLRESDSTPVSDIIAAYEKLPEELKKDMEQIAAGSDGAVIVKHKGGEFTVVENGKPVMKRVSADEVRKSGKLGKKQVTVVTKDEIGKMLSECDDADPEKMMKEFVEKDADPEKMMKEFVEKKEDGEVEEDEYRRPKNQPHNFHQVDEGEDVEDVEEDEYRRPKNQPHNLHSVDEGDEEFEDESEKPFELNESLVRFCDRLIRG